MLSEEWRTGDETCARHAPIDVLERMMWCGVKLNSATRNVVCSKVADFGLSTILTAGCSGMSLKCGTPAFQVRTPFLPP